MNPQNPLLSQQPGQQVTPNLQTSTASVIPAHRPFPDSQTGPVPQTTQPTVSAYTPIIGGDPQYEQKPESHWLKWVLIVAIVIVLLIAGGTTYWYTGRVNSNFKTTTYSDGKGDTFSLKFYKSSRLIAASSMPPVVDGQPLKGPDFLVGSGNYPLALSISKESKGSLYDKASLCGQPVVSLNNPANGQSSIVCHLSPIGVKQTIYFYEIKSGDSNYLVVMVPYFDYAAAQADPQKAQDTINNVDLTKYDHDLQTILSSLKVLN